MGRESLVAAHALCGKIQVVKRNSGLFVISSRPALRALLVALVGLWAGAQPVSAADRVAPVRTNPAGEIVIRNGTGQVVMQRIEPRLRWKNLQVAEPTQRLLRKIEADPAAKSGTPVLFTGADHAAKLRAAEILAAEMHLGFYRVDLSVVVSKYIGETEKNLDQIFDAVKHGGAVLFFDEADALFGQRTDVTDAHDRYANQEVSYLLQRVEQFEGLAILTTNLRQEIDPALRRRFRHVVEF